MSIIAAKFQDDAIDYDLPGRSDIFVKDPLNNLLELKILSVNGTEILMHF